MTYFKNDRAAFEQLKKLQKEANSSESDLSALLSRNGWGLRRHVEGHIIVSNENGSSVALRKGTLKNNVGVTESLFYDMMNDFITET